MTEGEVCLDYAKMAETQRQTQLDHASAVKKAPFKRKRNLKYRHDPQFRIGKCFRNQNQCWPLRKNNRRPPANPLSAYVSRQKRFSRQHLLQLYGSK